MRLKCEVIKLFLIQYIYIKFISHLILSKELSPLVRGITAYYNNAFFVFKFLLFSMLSSLNFFVFLFGPLKLLDLRLILIIYFLYMCMGPRGVEKNLFVCLILGFVK